MTVAPKVDFSDESEIARMLEDPELDSCTLESFAFRSFKLNRSIALHPNASPDLLAKLAQSPDKPTRRNVALSPQVPTDVLLQLAPAFAGEFFRNPVFDFLMMEDPNLLSSLPVGVLKNILKRDDCPDSFLNWAAMCGDKSHHLAVVSRKGLSKEILQLIAKGSSVKAAEIAAGRLMAGDFKE
jgi:hypothetical protein